METKNNKMKKPAPSQSATVESINDFSDEILTHILSFLSFRVAFRTTVLSKRWLPLCYSLPVLRFDDIGVKNTDTWNLFRQFVDAVMLSPHSQHLPLKSFQLNCMSIRWDAKSDCFAVNKWLEEAKRRDVEEITVLFLLGIPLAPTTIFMCKTLVVLRLNSIRVATMIGFSVDLPLLKKLDLYFVRFECMEDFMKLLSGCPNLEKLRTSYVKTTFDFTPEGYFDPMFNMVKSLVHLIDLDLADDSENLKKLISDCPMFEDLEKEDVYSSVDVKPLSKLKVANIHLLEVPLRVVSGVRVLTLVGLGQSLPNEEINTYYKGFSVFENLIGLRLFWFDHCIHDWGDVVTMLQNCPKLRTLSISKCQHPTTKEDWKYPDHVPECVSAHLTSCQIIDYEPLEADFRFATYILQNARGLRVMNIHPFPPKAIESPKFIEDLVSCPRISPSCKLSFE